MRGKKPLYNDDVMFLVKEKGIDPRKLLLEHVPTAERRFKRICTEMKNLLADVRREFPDAEYYTASGGFNLLLAKSHHPEKGSPQGDSTALGGVGVEIGDGDY